VTAPGSGRETAVLQAVVSLVDSLMHDFDIVELLNQLSSQCVELLNVASAGLLITDASEQLHLLAATSDRTRDLELFQLQAMEGPCLDCFTTGQPVTVGDLRDQSDRWPRFVEAASEAGFASVHAVPMRAAGLVLGTLGLFGTSAGELSEADLTLGQALAHIATVAIVQEHAPSPTGILAHLRGALTRRVVVEQAKGYLRAHFGVTVDVAYELLRRYARSTGAHLSDVARGMVSDREARSVILAGIAQLNAER
jgi:GAF domain/ANTAR domain